MLTIEPFLIPSDDAARLRTLQQYDVHSPFTEPVFDEMVALTARIFSLPISLIALVDKTEVRYIGNYGMPANMVQSRQEALCATAILHNKAIVYRDLIAEKDPFITSQAAQAAHTNSIRFYAAAALRMPDQRNIGTLCIVDYHPRTLSAEEEQMLELLAELISHVLVVRHLHQTQPVGGEAAWHTMRTQLEAEVQGLTALVRYMLTRYGVQVPVPTDVLAQVERRIYDLHEVLRGE